MPYQFRQARQISRRALAINPDDPDVTALLARVYQAEGKLDQAGKILEDAKIPPGDWGNFPVLVYQAFLARRYADASRLLQTVLTGKKALPPTARSTYYQLLGFAEHFAGRPDAARTAYIRALSVSNAAPDSPVVLLTRAEAQAGLGRKAVALDSLRQAMATTPARRDTFERPRGDVVLAEIQTLTGDDTQTIAALRRLLAMPLGSNASLLVTPALLRLNPVWDSLRKNPAFQALLKQYPVAPE